MLMVVFQGFDARIVCRGESLREVFECKIGFEELSELLLLCPTSESPFSRSIGEFGESIMAYCFSKVRRNCQQHIGILQEVRDDKAAMNWG